MLIASFNSQKFKTKVLPTLDYKFDRKLWKQTEIPKILSFFSNAIDNDSVHLQTNRCIMRTTILYQFFQTKGKNSVLGGPLKLVQRSTSPTLHLGLTAIASTSTRNPSIPLYSTRQCANTTSAFHFCVSRTFILSSNGKKHAKPDSGKRNIK